MAYIEIQYKSESSDSVEYSQIVQLHDSTTDDKLTESVLNVCNRINLLR